MNLWNEELPGFVSKGVCGAPLPVLRLSEPLSSAKVFQLNHGYECQQERGQTRHQPPLGILIIKIEEKKEICKISIVTVKSI
jgi:hypothetical protein